MLVASKFGGLLSDGLGDGDLLFLVSVLLLLVLGFLNLEDRFLFIVEMLLLDNVGGLNTLRDVGKSFILSIVGIVLRTLNLGVELGDLVSLISDLIVSGDLLLGLRLKDVLDGGDLRDKRGQLMLVGLDLTALSGSSDLGVEFLLLLSKSCELALVLADNFLSFLDNLLLTSDGSVDLLFLDNSNLLDLGVFFSQLLGILFLLNDLAGDVRCRSSGTGRGTSNISLDGNTRDNTAVVSNRGTDGRRGTHTESGIFKLSLEQWKSGHGHTSLDLESGHIQLKLLDLR